MNHLRRSVSEARLFSVASLCEARPVLACGLVVALLSTLLLLAISQPAVAQFQISDEQLQKLTPEQRAQFEKAKRRMMRRRSQSQPVAKPAKKKEEKKPEKKKEEKKDDKKKEEGTKTIKRPTDGSTKLDPNRIRLEPDANGLVQFNYSGHPWANVLQEYADAAKLSFDWQELPADSLNLVTQRKYTLRAARDLLNRHMLARGFTLVVQGEMLTAVKIDQLDPSLVPRVEADDLEDYLSHDFVRVRFELPKSMDPAKVKDDVKLLLSPKAKVVPLLATKRLLVIDAVANLRSVRDLLYAEQSAENAIVKPEVRQIKYRRAGYIADQIMIVLGKDPASRKSPQEMQLEKQRLQLYMQIQQKGKDVSKFIKSDGPPVHIAEDAVNNRLFINAPPELMPTIDRTIEQFDVRPHDGDSMATDATGRSTRPHKTVTASTDAVVSALTEFGQLDPLTRLQSDARTKTIFAYATEADHLKIDEMIAKLDSSGRDFHVIQLRRRPAAGVAGTLMTILVGDEKKQENNNRRGGFFSFGRRREEPKKEAEFRATADIESNQLILWANAEELKKVYKMLAELGESPRSMSRNTEKVRVLRPRTPEETVRLLERLKKAYPGRLNIDASSMKPTAKKQEKPKEQDKVTQNSPLKKSRFFLTQLEVNAQGQRKQELGIQQEVATEGDGSRGGGSEVNIVIADDGRIVISSSDPAALQQLEDLIQVIEPDRKEFEIFKLEHITALTVKNLLEEYFAEELKVQTETVFDEWGNNAGQREKDLGRATLGRRQLLRFVDNSYTNSIVVQGASSSQLAVIRQLIGVYDQPPKSDLNFYKRETEVIPLKYSRAEDVAKSIKEVYRELLSSKDKEFQDKDGNQPFSGRPIPYAFGEAQVDKQGRENPVLIDFEGVLAIGVDSVSNALIISARKEVLKSVKETVMLLDKAATPNTMIHVHRVGGGIRSAERLQKMLKESMSQAWPGGKPQQANTNRGRRGQRGQQQANQNQNNNRSRRRGR